MATQRRTNQHKIYNSITDVVANTLTLEDSIMIDYEYFYIGVRYYSDIDGTPVVPSAGTVLIEALDETTNQWTPTAAPLDATDVTAKQNFQGNVLQVRAVPTAITGATHFQLFVSANL